MIRCWSAWHFPWDLSVCYTDFSSNPREYSNKMNKLKKNLKHTITIGVGFIMLSRLFPLGKDACRKTGNTATSFLDDRLLMLAPSPEARLFAGQPDELTPDDHQRPVHP